MKSPGSFGKTVAFGLGLTALVGVSGCDEDLLNPMAARQPKLGAYSPSDFYSDGMAMRQPPPGTVPRERITGNGALTSGRQGPDLVTTFPIKVDDALLRLGQKRYNITCGTCHGPLGDGDSIVARQMALKPPPSLMLFANRPVGYLFEVATQGHGLMAAYAAELTVKERWAVVAYVKALQRSATATLAELPASERARLEKETP
ncbi:MAG TPA: cytochrome c [Polyangia bacterium]